MCESYRRRHESPGLEIEGSTAGATWSGDLEGIPWIRRMEPPPKPKIPQFIPYDIPVRPGVHARLVLPMDLSQKDAERLCGVIRAVAFSE